MSLRQFLFSQDFKRNFIRSVIVVVILLIVTFLSLRIYTRHGQEKPVPDFRGMSFIQAKRMAMQHDLRIKIADSLYRDGAIAGSVIEQYPAPGFKVKKNRTISLTVNSNSPETVIVPKLTDISLRQAQAFIENCGLALGKVSYKPSEFESLVLEVYTAGSEVKPGDKLKKGTQLELVVGKPSGDFQSTVPDLTGVSFEEAKQMLTNAYLSLGAVIYDETIISRDDTLNMIVWKQQPNPLVIPYVDLGTLVDIWVTADPLKVSKEPDSNNQ